MEYHLDLDEGKPIRIRFKPSFVSSTGHYNDCLGDIALRSCPISNWTYDGKEKQLVHSFKSPAFSAENVLPMVMRAQREVVAILDMFYEWKLKRDIWHEVEGK